MALVVKGYRQFVRAATRAERESRKEVRAALRQVGEPVRQDAARRFQTVDARSAAGYRVRVRQRGVAVEQSLRKTTGTRPDYGAKQMRDALLPAVADNEQLIEREAERAVDRIADHFENR